MKSVPLIWLVAQILLPLPSLAEGRAVVHGETYWQRRSDCQIRSVNYTGVCVLTVLSFGRSMNVHFDIDSIGSKGLTFGGNQVVTTSHGATLRVIGVTERFDGPDQSEMIDGECAIEFADTYSPREGQQIPWEKTTRIICVSEDGRFNATAQ